MSVHLVKEALMLERLLPMVIQMLFHAPDDPLANMPLAQLKIIRSLHEAPATATNLASRYKLSKPAISQLMGRLMKREMIQQTIDPADARIKIISLSEKANDLMKKREEARARHAAAVLAQLPLEEVKQLRELLDRCASL